MRARAARTDSSARARMRVMCSARVNATAPPAIEPVATAASVGTAGVCDVFGHKISDGNKVTWKFKGSKGEMYQTEHNELFASIRNAAPINNGEYMTRSTLMGLMGRMSAYTGKTITWEQALNSREDLSPPRYAWDVALPDPPVAMPGVTRFS